MSATGHSAKLGTAHSSIYSIDSTELSIPGNHRNPQCISQHTIESAHYPTLIPRKFVFANYKYLSSLCTFLPPLTLNRINAIQCITSYIRFHEKF